MEESQGRRPKYSLEKTLQSDLFLKNDFQMDKYISALAFYVFFGVLGTPSF